MGYALIKDIDGSKNYALNRQMQNLVPKDTTKHVKLSVSTTFAYEKVSDDTYKLSQINLVGIDNKVPTQPYVFKGCNSQGEIESSRAGVNVDEISGVVTLGDTWDGEEVWVKLIPITAEYNSTVYYSGTQANINPVRVVSSSYTLTALFGSSTVSAAKQDTLKLTSFKIKKGNKEVATNVNDEGVTAFNVSSSESWVTINSSSSGKTLTIQKYSGDTDRKSTITCTCYYNGELLTYSYTLTQKANVIDTVSYVSGPLSVSSDENTVSISNYSVKVTYTNGNKNESVTPTYIGLTPNATSDEVTLSGSNNTVYLIFVANEVSKYATISVSVTSSEGVTYGDLWMEKEFSLGFNNTRNAVGVVPPAGETELQLFLPTNVQQYVNGTLQPATNVVYKYRTGTGSEVTINDTTKITISPNDTTENKTHKILATVEANGYSSQKEFTVMQGPKVTTGFSTVEMNATSSNKNGGVTGTPDSNAAGSGYHVTIPVQTGKTKIDWILYIPSDSEDYVGYTAYGVHAGTLNDIPDENSTWSSDNNFPGTHGSVEHNYLYGTVIKNVPMQGTNIAIGFKSAGLIQIKYKQH